MSYKLLTDVTENLKFRATGFTLLRVFQSITPEYVQEKETGIEIGYKGVKYEVYVRRDGMEYFMSVKEMRGKLFTLKVFRSRFLGDIADNLLNLLCS